MVHAVSCDLGIMIHWLDSVVPYPVRQLGPPGTLHKKNDCLSDHKIGSMICSVILSITNLFVQFFFPCPLDTVLDILTVLIKTSLCWEIFLAHNRIIV